MRDNPLAMFVFRNGDDNVMIGNTFIDSGGIRIKQGSLSSPPTLPYHHRC